MAELLAARGHRVLIFEEHPVVGEPVCCTGIVGRECLERFPVPPDLVRRSLSSATIISPSGYRLQIAREQPQAFLLDRAMFDRMRLDRAISQGVEVMLAARVVRIVIGERVEVEVRLPGERALIRGRCVVLACGLNSQLLEQVYPQKAEETVIGTQVYAEIDGVSDVEIYCGSKVSPGFFAWIVPLSPNRGLVGMLSQHPVHDLDTFLHRLNREGKVVSWDRPVYKRIPLKPLPQTFGERFIIVGEAAGQVKATTGGGIYYGLLAAECAAETLDLALSRCDLSEAFLSRYEKEWHRILKREIDSGLRLHRIYRRMSDGQLDRLLSFLGTTGLANALLKSRDLSFDWHAGFLARFIGSRPGMEILRWLGFF